MLLSGCSASRIKSSRSKVYDSTVKGNIEFKNISRQNLTSRSFYIEKAEFRIKTGEGEKSGLGTIKFKMPDKFLISIKSRSGIEGTRIFFTGDSIFINDRMSRKLYYGSASYLKNKYGLTTGVLPIILGDYVDDGAYDSKVGDCVDGVIKTEGKVKNLKIRYIIDCKYGKCISATPENDAMENKLILNYSEFYQRNDINVPGKIEISDIQTRTTIEIKILKIESPWEGSIDFIPGKQYEKINLL